MSSVGVGLGGCGPTAASGDATTDGDTTAAGSTTAMLTTEAPPATTTAADTTTTTAADESTSGTTGPAAICGNGALEPGEQCDGTHLGESTCLDLFGYAGEIACTDACTYDLLGCTPPGMMLIPAGEFEMGSDSFSDDERPARQVNVDAFFIDITEVTVEDYTQCVTEGDCDVPGTGGACNWAVMGREDHPINCVTWDDAYTYCNHAGTVFNKRLPTEAEWEKAARSDDARLWPWGNVPLPSCTNVTMNEGPGGGCGNYHSVPVGTKPLGDSPYGLHDMAGSVWEWTADWYAVYDVSETDNPTGPPTGTLRVMRGGGWNTSEINWFRTSARYGQSETSANNGFRCAQDPATLE